MLVRILCLFLLPAWSLTMAHETKEMTPLIATVIDAETLKPYYHVDTLADRSPLRIQLNSVLDHSLPLTAFGEPVAFVTEDPHLVLTRLIVNGDSAEVELRYLPEGIRGSLSLSRQGGIWTIIDSHIVEE